MFVSVETFRMNEEAQSQGCLRKDQDYPAIQKYLSSRSCVEAGNLFFQVIFYKTTKPQCFDERLY